MIALSIVAAIAGFALLCLGMSRHQRDLLPRTLSARTTTGIKALGWCCLALSFGGAMLIEGAALGAVYGVGALTFGALVVAFCVTGMSR